MFLTGLAHAVSHDITAALILSTQHAHFALCVWLHHTCQERLPEITQPRFKSTLCCESHYFSYTYKVSCSYWNIVDQLQKTKTFSIFSYCHSSALKSVSSSRFQELSLHWLYLSIFMVAISILKSVKLIHTKVHWVCNITMFFPHQHHLASQCFIVAWKFPIIIIPLS